MPAPSVHCRIGSSENQKFMVNTDDHVHCRIGSSEIGRDAETRVTQGSLPHRQLRKQAHRSRSVCVGSLPHRQLRKQPRRCL